MIHYIQTANNKILDNEPFINYQENGIVYPIIKKEVSDEIYSAYCEDKDAVISQGDAIVLNPDYENIKKEKERKRAIISLKEKLNTLDLKSIRSIRDNDIEYIQKYQEEAEILREQIRELEGE